MAIIVGIDGTGPKDDFTYSSGFADSFVSRVCHLRPATDFPKYIRGPDWIGVGIRSAVAAAVAHVDAFRARPAGDRLLLTGFSRGGLAALLVAEALRARSIMVDAMLLFDPVDRYLPADCKRIPPNVSNVLIARRQRIARSRESFGYMHLQHSGADTTREDIELFGTHGAMGGTPWVPKPGQPRSDLIVESPPDGKTRVSFDQEAKTVSNLWRWCCVPFLRTHGFAA